MMLQKHKDFLEALKKNDLAAVGKLCELLWMREPMHVSYGGTGGKITIPDLAYCPRCGAGLGDFYEAPSYCPDCGQALDWESGDEG